ncbi:MAG: hypothetical protein KF724_11560 [Phycisphaeraceae bacterium]|nr:hypothetical protein [Phycisphaeraceae bacterium]
MEFASKESQLVLRLLKGEAANTLSHTEVGVSTARLSQWRDDFLAAGQSGLQSRSPDERDTLIHDLKAAAWRPDMTIN